MSTLWLIPALPLAGALVNIVFGRFLGHRAHWIAVPALAGLRKPVDAFFDHVTVNDSDPQKRSRRLNLLARLRDAVDRVADFSKIEG